MLLLLYAVGALMFALIFLAFKALSKSEVVTESMKATGKDPISGIKKQLDDEIARNKELQRQLDSTKEKLKFSEEEVNRLNSELKVLAEVHNGLKDQYDELERMYQGSQRGS